MRVARTFRSGKPEGLRDIGLGAWHEAIEGEGGDFSFKPMSCNDICGQPRRNLMPPMKDVQRRQEIRRHWLARPENKRTVNDLLIFHGWLEDNHPYLLKAGDGDPYQQLKVDLGGVWSDERA